jgi:hypothetical protein
MWRFLNRPEIQYTKERIDMALFPNFFVIGAPKSGTTSLCRYLEGHPNIFFSKLKEPQYFNFDSSKWLRPSLKSYRSLFSTVNRELHKAVGEGSTCYLFSCVAVAEILKKRPDAKFIVMLRNPIELVQAWHSEMFWEGIEDISDFEKAWNMQEVRKSGGYIPRTCWEPNKLFYAEWGALGNQIERLLSVADRNAVKIILFEDFVANPKVIYEDVLSFLEVPADARTEFPIFNDNRMVRWPWLQRRVAFAANYFRMFRIITGLDLGIGTNVFPRILRINSNQASRIPISPDFRRYLQEYYRQDLKKLSALLDRDLSQWA